MAVGTPEVSVLMPVYNGERYLREALDSVLSQTFGDFELIIVDDGSMDGSLAILEEYAAEDDRIRLSSGPNRGIVPALNEMIEQARGRYLARMDADDVCLPERFERQVEYMRAHERCVALGAWAELTCPRGVPYYQSRNPTDHESIERMLLTANGAALIHPLVMMRKDAVEAIGGYREPYTRAEDLDLFLRLALAGRLANLDVVLFRYRFHFANCHQHEYQRHVVLRERAVREAMAARGMSGEPDLVPYIRRTRASQLRQWGWGALRHGERGLALRYGLGAVGCAPWAVSGYRLLACAVRGY